MMKRVQEGEPSVSDGCLRNFHYFTSVSDSREDSCQGKLIFRKDYIRHFLSQKQAPSLPIRSHQRPSPKQLSIFLLFIFLIIFCPLKSISATANDNSFLNPKFTNLIKERPYLKIAVLPVQNFSVDPDIAWFFRQRLTENLKAKGFSVIDLETLDQILYRKGLTHAGQLTLLSVDELKNLVHADLFLSGVVEQAAIQHSGLYNGYVYTCSLKLQGQSGENLWYALQERVAKRRFAVDPVNALLDVFLVEHGGDHKTAVMALADRMLEKFPTGPAKVLIADPLLDAAVEISATSD